MSMPPLQTIVIMKKGGKMRSTSNKQKKLKYSNQELKLLFTEKGLQKKKYPVSGCCEGQGLVDVRGLGSDWLETIERQQ